ncbi:T6SS effector phospholipase Tle3 domain-containing protein [Rugamonas rubra]|uniref:T6SS Tle3 phospholipase effector alpha/beta domain-containing protein n=1 Tax=Rugamonas rubra TaxID=758825 RepID=A0A1I4U0B9_9BURK|nr:hypothetical protein [Rugamonas rubra]SFM82325.1 hypothetical protein SAMN02982985_05430 [Rugamonas rubra]
MKKTRQRKVPAAGTTNAAPSPLDDPNNVLVGWKTGITLLNHDYLDVIMQMPLPGIVIFVHGVNSDGEWYKETEEGLCAGLNARLKRCDEHMAYPTPEGGQLTPATYLPELTADGFISPNMQSDTFMKDDDHFTPVIHFRWGYKAGLEELQEYGDSVYLNEENYWGGGPFANGCTSLPDMWGKGLSANMFLWMQVEHLNPTNNRQVYSCPPRPYYVLAALRLARLVESIRRKQADVPITIVCHSQGNMIGMAAAFLGDRLAPVADVRGLEGRCVADNYVLCNAPYSLVNSNFTEDWTEGHMKDKQGGTGRQTEAARIATLAAFFDIIRQPASRQQQVEDINKFVENNNHPFNAADDRKQYGYGIAPATCQRVTLYCNPHDQVISSMTVQGIGWRGLSKKEIDATKGVALLCQRVFAEGHRVGVKDEHRGVYRYWEDHYRKPEAGTHGYWFPESPTAEYSLVKGLKANQSFVGRVLSVLSAPFMIVATKLAGMHINALPDEKWEIQLTAPDLPKPFMPQALRFGAVEKKFEQSYESPGQSRDPRRVRGAGEPYAGDRPIKQREGEDKREDSDAALGNEDSEATMRYEDHARLRMQAKREGWAKNDQQVVGEEKSGEASAEYKEWRETKIKTYLAENIDTHATNHSTIMTNGMHAEAALAYDVAVGLCHIRDKDLHKLRMAADWRFLEGLEDDDPNKRFAEYFESGYFKKVTPYKWTTGPGSEGSMPDKIVDQREHPARKASPRRGGHP